MPDDTQRLDWLLNHPGAEIDSSKSKAWIRWFSGSNWYIVELHQEEAEDGLAVRRRLLDRAIAGKITKLP